MSMPRLHNDRAGDDIAVPLPERLELSTARVVVRRLGATVIPGFGGRPGAGRAVSSIRPLIVWCSESARGRRSPPPLRVSRAPPDDYEIRIFMAGLPNVVKEVLHRLMNAAAGVTRIHESPTRGVADSALDASRTMVREERAIAETMDRTFGDRPDIAARPHTQSQGGLPAARREELTDELASRLHNEWRAPRLRDDGFYEERPKQVRDDQEWIAEHGTDQVDIANTDYRDLPLDYRRENQESAKVALPLALDEYLAGRDPARAGFVEDASEQVHIAWLDRNRDWAPPDQSLPYSRLSEEEKEKDRVVVRAAVDLINEQLRDGPA